MVEDGRRDAWVGVSDLLDLVGQPQHHLSEQLGVGLEHVCSVALRRRRVGQTGGDAPAEQTFPWQQLVTLTY